MSKALKAHREPSPEKKPGATETHHGPRGLADLPDVLVRASMIINKMLESLRAGQEVLKSAAVEKLHTTNEKLSEISSATETAATDIMDGIDRAMVLLDQLDGDDVGPKGAEIGGQVRDELFMVMNHLQFQDITSQQLSHASSIIQDMERYLDEFAGLFDVNSFGRIPDREPEPSALFPRAFDPAATTRDAESRQAVVDELLTLEK